MNIMHIPDSEFITLWIRTRSTKDKLIFKTSHMKIGWIATWRRKIKTHSLSLILIALNIKLVLSDFDANQWKYTQDPILSPIKIARVLNIFKSFLPYVKLTKSAFFHEIERFQPKKSVRPTERILFILTR